MSNFSVSQRMLQLAVAIKQKVNKPDIDAIERKIESYGDIPTEKLKTLAEIPFYRPEDEFLKPTNSPTETYEFNRFVGSLEPREPAAAAANWIRTSLLRGFNKQSTLLEKLNTVPKALALCAALDRLISKRAQVIPPPVGDVVKVGSPERTPNPTFPERLAQLVKTFPLGPMG